MLLKIFQNHLLLVIFSLWLKVEYATPLLDADPVYRHHPEIWAFQIPFFVIHPDTQQWCAFFLYFTEANQVNETRTQIKKLRAQYNLTKEDLVIKVGVRRETILFMEKGKYNPSLKLIHDIAKAVETTIDELFIFEDGMIS